MCGNGLRVFVRWLPGQRRRRSPCPRPRSVVGTRDGVKTGEHRTLGHGGGWARDHRRHGYTRRCYGDTEVSVGQGVAMREWPAQPRLDMGNPHAVAFVDDLADAGAAARASDATTPRSTPTASTSSSSSATGRRHVAMRVHERGSGETRSCGTGACAVLVAAATRRPGRSHREHDVTYRVDVPGGDARRSPGPSTTGCCSPAQRCSWPRGSSSLPTRWPSRSHPTALTPGAPRRRGRRYAPTHGHQRSLRPRHRWLPAGIGAAVARQLAAKGATVVVADLQADKGECARRRDRWRLRPGRRHPDRPDHRRRRGRGRASRPLRAVVNSAGIGWAQRTIGRDGQIESAHEPRGLHARWSRST